MHSPNNENNWRKAKSTDLVFKTNVAFNTKSFLFASYRNKIMVWS
jgi:hypothetical protein